MNKSQPLKVFNKRTGTRTGYLDHEGEKGRLRALEVVDPASVWNESVRPDHGQEVLDDPFHRLQKNTLAYHRQLTDKNLKSYNETSLML
jgi:hypothetical protein